jgi:hypothetical protein
MRVSVLPVMTVLTIIAGAVGLQLGESAIGQIDPTYFQGALEPPRDVTKDPRPSRAPGFAQASGWAQGYQALAADCGGCSPVSGQSGPAPAAPLYTYSDATIEPRWQQAAAAVTADEPRLERSVESAQLQRYLHYPVSADQAEIRTALEGRGTPGEAQEPAGL